MLNQTKKLEEPTMPQVKAITRRSVLGASLAAGLASPRIGRAADDVRLTMWTWVPNKREDLDLFEQAYPGIKVDLVNAGQGPAHYTKLRTAMRAGTGAPDVCIAEFHMIPSLRQVGALLDLSPYGASAISGDYVPWSWQQVSDGDHVYAIPSDSGPIALLYRRDVFEKHAITPPVTWDGFAEAAIKLHTDAPDVFLTDMQLNAGAWFTSLAWQAGSRPFAVDGTTVTIRINDDPARKVAAFWQKLIDAHAIDTAPSNTADWYQSTDQGRYASWIAAAWAPLFLSQFAHASAGQWRVAPIPQWDVAKPVSANFGGSTTVVTTQSKHPKEAALLATYLGHDPRLIEHRITEHFAFPTLEKVLDAASFQERKFPFYGDQPINKVFVESGRQVDGSFQWSPFQDYVFAQMSNEMSAAAAGQGTLVASLDRIQSNVVKFAKSQGFTVKA